MLKNTFIELISGYTDDKKLMADLWNEVELNYSSQKRHYHTLIHLENLLKQLVEVKDKIASWETILFTLFYHDIIYSATKSTNEEESAALAEIRMKQISVPEEIIERCKEQIIATKKHLHSPESDTNYFTDADLSILGQEWDSYSQYYKNVRKEYSIYPGIVYNPGRKKVLKHFLDMPAIYKTDHFYDKFEKKAKDNLQAESDLL